MAKKAKYYVVWKGYQTGIYDQWDNCKKQVEGFPNPQYKSFETLDEARVAFQKKPSDYIVRKPTISKQTRSTSQIDQNSICVDAACSGNPGDMEYRGVDLQSNTEIFRKGPYREGTNNIGEFLAIVHGIGWLIRNASNKTIYSDSATAIGWVKNKKAKTKLERSHLNEALFDLIERAELFLQTQDISQFTILKWETKVWGEIPADFGRK